MKHLPRLFENNRAWAAEMVRTDPEFFLRLSGLQAPPYLWIGCSDSRVPANQIVGLLPGELFVHRNVANLVNHGDLNVLSTLHFAIAVLGVSHVIVCGHLSCGGVLAALRGERHGLVDDWLRPIGDLRDRHLQRLAPLATEKEQHERLCRLNVVEQVLHVSETSVVRDAWARGQKLTVHGWIYSLRDGLLEDLGVTGTNEAEIAAAYAQAIEKLDR
jgi:carbonic anhydrase